MLITSISIYCVFSYLFMVGVATNLPTGKKFKRWIVPVSPLYVPFLLGEHVIVQMRVNAGILRKQQARERKEHLKQAAKAAEISMMDNAFSQMVKELESLLNVGKSEPVKPKDTRSEWQKRMDEMRHRPTPTHDAEKAMRDFFNGKW